ncbi:MAG: glycosyltransferase family 2 protein [Nitrospirota bacterium]
MKVSIITAVFNNEAYIEDCIKSVSGQTYKDIEYIIIDGGSTDGTVNIIKEHGSGISKWISKPDEGIYDALNKGLGLATGDIVGFLHADDLYADKRVIERVVSEMTKHNVDSCYGDLLYVDKHDIEKIIRFWKSCNYAGNLFYRGWMPPHPTFFVKKKIYDNYGYFNTDFRIAADYELMLRFLVKHKITTHYIPEVLIKMRVGGASNRNLRNMIVKTAEDYKAWKINNLDRKFYTIPLKNISKLPQFFKKME